MSTHKGAEAALSAAHASQSENVPENSHADRSHAQSVDSAVDSQDTKKLKPSLSFSDKRYTTYFSCTKLNVLTTTKYALVI